MLHPSSLVSILNLTWGGGPDREGFLLEPLRYFNQGPLTQIPFRRDNNCSTMPDNARPTRNRNRLSGP